MTDLDKLDALCASEIMGGDLSKKTLDLFWKPTINIAQAWEVLEKLDCDYTIDGGTHCETKEKYVEVDVRVRIDDLYCTFAKTAPLAIVLAALKSKGIEVE